VIFTRPPLGAMEVNNRIYVTFLDLEFKEERE
jgi:hypothetical protein